MKINEIMEAVSTVKPCSRAQVYRHIAALKIEPIGARQRPQQYPANSAQRILEHLGHAAPQKIITVKRAKQLAGRGGK